jgi:ubiquinone/menaquinone biosynthesis C-methylase UbiE
MPGLCDKPPPAVSVPVDLGHIDRAVAADRLPEYAETLAAFHRAFAPELRRMLADAWLRRARRVADVACGDGCYSVWLAELAGTSGRVYSVDLSRHWLNVARGTARRGAADGQQQTIAANALRLPFADNCLDFVWCAQSLYSLPDAAALLREVHRVLRSAGRVAVLENDSLHQLLLPWDAELELKIRTAELAALQRRTRHPDKFYVGRDLSRRLLEAGFTSCRKRTYATNRDGPLTGDVLVFVEGYLRALRDSVKDDLAPADLAAFDRLLAHGDRSYFLDDPSIAITTIDHVVCGHK